MAGVVLIALSPVLLICAVLVWGGSRGPIIFRQVRVGRNGKLFELIKFRSMWPHDGTGVQVTSREDDRVTPVGRILRRTKLDELPELWNVVRGDIGLVGPRPEVPRYVDLSNPLWQRVLCVRPGITDPVTLRLRNEEELIAAASGDSEVFYRQVLLPYKLRGYVAYLSQRTFWSDVRVLVKSLAAVVVPSRVPVPSMQELIGSQDQDCWSSGA